MHVTGRCRIVGLGLMALCAVLLLPVAAAAAKPEIVHVNVDETFPDNICGIAGTSAVKGVFTDKTFFDKAGNFVEFQSTASFTVTFTAENGKSIRLHNAGQYSFTQEEIADGVFAFYDTYKGLPEQIKGSKGGPLVRDAGLITFITVIDFNTDPPTVVDTDVVIKGPHPEADSDFTLFCEVISAALA